MTMMPSGESQTAPYPLAPALDWQPDAPASIEMAATCAKLGITQVCLHLTDAGAIRAAANRLPEDVRRWAESGISIRLVAAPLPRTSWPADRERSRVRAAVESLTVLLDAAAASRIPDVEISIGRAQEVHRSEDALSHYLETLLAVRFEAEMRGVRISAGVGSDPILPTPADARAFIDECNSAWIGASLNVALNLPMDRIDDWALSLGRRIFVIRVPASVGRADRDDIQMRVRRLVAAAIPPCPIIFDAGDLSSGILSDQLGILRNE